MGRSMADVTAISALASAMGDRTPVWQCGPQHASYNGTYGLFQRLAAACTTGADVGLCGGHSSGESGYKGRGGGGVGHYYKV
jgi:hypothetical protein